MMNSKARSKYQLGMLTEREEPPRYEMEGRPWKCGIVSRNGLITTETQRAQSFSVFSVLLTHRFFS
jgi:hypothetical protein